MLQAVGLLSVKPIRGLDLKPIRGLDLNFDQAVENEMDQALEQINNLAAQDIVEIKAFLRPPYKIRILTQALCVMFNIQPEFVNDPDNSEKKIKDYWRTAKRYLLGNIRKFIQDLLNYDKDNVPFFIIREIEPIINDPDFTPESMRTLSVAAQALCMWTRALYRYYQVTAIFHTYAKIRIGTQNAMTNESENTGRNPTWDEELKFEISNEEEIEIKLFDKDRKGNERCLGECRTSILEWIANGSFEGEINLVDKSGKLAGQIAVSARFT